MSRKSTSRIQSRSDSSRESHLGSSSSQQDGYRFSLVNGQVSNLQEYERGRWKNETIDRNESWAFDGTTLTKTETERGRVKTSTYLDSDGDGIFTKSGRDTVTGLNSSSSNSSYPSAGYGRISEDSYRFSLVNAQVSNLQEYERGRWKNETIDRNESWAFDGTNLIQQEIKRYGMQTTTYSDPDGDGIFSKGTETFSPATVNLSVSSVF